MIRRHQFWIRMGDRFDSPVIHPDEQDFLRHHPIARFDRQARRPGIEFVVVDLPEFAPTRVVEKRVTGKDVVFAQPLPLQRRLNIIDGNFLGSFEGAPL